jgi:cardiolipin synthase A/B
MRTALILGYFATWAFIPHLLMLKKRPSGTLAWLWAIIFIPFVGALVYFALGTDRLKRHRLRRRKLYSARVTRQGAPPGATDEATELLVAELSQPDRQFLQLLSRINQLPVASASDLRILRDAAEFYAALEARIQKAKHHIHLEFYIWNPDETGARFLRLLAGAARRGVIVRLLLDGVGSHDFNESLLEEFQAAGGRFSWFQSLDPKRNRFFLNLRNHRKLQVVDGLAAFVGGMNIGREYEGLDEALGHWRDVQVEAQGAVVNELQDVFADDWFFATGERITASHFFPQFDGSARQLVHVIPGGPDRRNEPISKSIVSLLNEASERVWIATGYFVPDDVALTALELAACRGVDVRLLISEKNDHPFLVVVGRSYYGQLLEAGVRIFEYSVGINHAKVMLVDDRWSMVGSANLDYRSMRLNFELNLLVHSADRNAELADILEHDFRLCQEIDPESFSKRSFRKEFLEAALRPLSPML